MNDVFLRKYSQQDGLSSFYVRQIIQDKHGFLYVATQEGLDRFDGKNFVHYRKTNEADHRLAGIDIRAVIEDPQNNLLWVLPGENGINAINTVTGKVVQFIPLKRDNENEWNLSLFLNNDKLLIGTAVGVKVYDISRKVFLPNLSLMGNSSKSAQAYQVRAINKDYNGNIWVCYSGFGIVIYDSNLLPLSVISNNILSVSELNGASAKLNAIIFADESNALVATSIGLRKVSFDKNYLVKINISPCVQNEDVNRFAVQNVYKTRAGEIYVAGAKHLYRFDKSLFNFTIINDQIFDSRNDWLSNVINVFEDRDNAIWLGCNQGLAFFKPQPSPFTVLYTSKTSTDRLEHVTGFFKSSNQEIFISLFNGLAVAKPPYSSFTVIDKGYMFYHCFQDYEGRVHVSRSDGMFIYQNNLLIPIETIYPEFRQFTQTPVNSHVFLNDSIVILGTENYAGILIWNCQNHSVTRIAENTDTPVKLGSGIVNAVYKDAEGKIWVLSDNVITILSAAVNNAKIITLYDKKAGLPAGLFFDVCDYNGKYYVASYGTGLIQLDKTLNIEHVFSVQDGLSNDGLYKIFPYNNKLIITTNFGISVFDDKQHQFKNYFRSDGLHSNNFEEAVGFVTGDTIYTGGLQGVTIIKPALFYENVKPPGLFINSVSIKTQTGLIDSANLFYSKCIIPSNTIQTIIHFSGINFSDPDRTVFAYKIKEQSGEWINLNSQNFVTLIGLSPGTYHLQVKVANEDGVWSEPKELILVFLPKWYQTWWFYALIALTVAAILYALYRYRISQIKKQHQIRKNIATDLHDDLGSTLNSVKVFTNLAISGVKQEESLQQVKDNLTEATMSLRDMIWVLDDSMDTVDELVTRLKQFAIPVTAASNMEFVITAGSDVNSRTLTKEEKRNLFLICKEAINNSIKYSGATQITVAIMPAGKKIQITVADNGKGFDEATVKKGYGLKNMQYRAGQIRYNASLQSQMGKGTIVILQPV